MTNNYESLEFLTGLVYRDTEYVGIVVNHDDSILTFYDVGKLSNDEQKKAFLMLGELWWWESNRQIPIDIFLYHEMAMFRPCLKSIAMKDLNVLFGPLTSLNNLLKKKRVKRRTIQLIKKSD